MIVVADTSPINYLILIGQVDLLRILFQNIVIPQAVFHELSSPLTPPPVRAWIAQPPPWAAIRHAAFVPTIQGLGMGELEAMELARELGADLLLLDDAAARKQASLRGLAITGTIGVLERAALQNLVDLPTCLHDLKEQTSCYITNALISAAVTRLATRKIASPDGP